MLDDFLTEERAEIIARCRIKVRGRRAPTPSDREIERGIPLFLDQLVETLRSHRSNNPDREGVATRHGRDLRIGGFTIAQVVHDYGDVCQSVTELAIERGAPISNEDFRVLNRCLDDAIADAVTEFSRLRDLTVATENNERLGILTHEMRNLLASAALTFDVLRSGSVGVAGSTAAALDRLLTRLGSLVDRSIAGVRLEASNLRRERIAVHHVLQEIESEGGLLAKRRKVTFSYVPPIELELAVTADPQILSAVVINLVQNAVKFTRDGGSIVLTARAVDERVEIDVADECGGLPPGAADAMFRPFEQLDTDRTGLGLGLVFVRRAAEAMGGAVRVRDLPGTGCVFTIDMPRAR